MFGYILTDSKDLTSEEKARYSGAYCGLCHSLGDGYGSAGRNTLTYDMTFLSILLGSLYELDEKKGSERCIQHPVGKKDFIKTEASVYCADMNIVMAWYQSMDDWQDDKSRSARQTMKGLENFIPAISEKYPRQMEKIGACMECLGKMERANELNPDLPANCFGELLGEVFVWREDGYSENLRRIGASLGRFIYLLDASNDLVSDIKKQRYNPLVSLIDTEISPILTVIMGECTAEFEKLPILRDRHLLQNILYSGVWQKYKLKRTGAEADA